MNFEKMKQEESKARKERVKREKKLAAREERSQVLTKKSTALQWEEKQYNENPNDPSVAYRLATARLCADIDAKARTEPAHEARRQQGIDTVESVRAELSKKSWRKPYNKSRIAGKISEVTGIPVETVRPIVTELLREDNNG